LAFDEWINLSKEEQDALIEKNQKTIQKQKKKQRDVIFPIPMPMDD